MFPRTFTTLILALALSFGSQVFMPADAEARPGSILSQSRKSGKRVHKGKRSTSSSKKKSTKGKKSSSRTTTRRTRTTRTTRPSSSNRRVVRRTTTRSAPTGTTTRRTVRRSPSTHTRTRTTRTVHRSQPRVRRSYYRSGHRHTSHRRVRSSSHSHSSHHTSTSSSTSGSTHGRATTEPYITGGLGISGFASNQIVDGALPGIGYNLAVGAKGKLFGAELGLNGGGYTFTPGTVSTDLALVGLSGDLKIQPSIAFFEPFAVVGIGGYALHDGIVDEASAGVGLRLGAGADFRFDHAALRISYMFGAYGLGNDSNAYGGGDIGARTETLSAGVLFYF